MKFVKRHGEYYRAGEKYEKVSKRQFMRLMLEMRGCKYDEGRIEPNLLH